MVLPEQTPRLMDLHGEGKEFFLSRTENPDEKYFGERRTVP